MSGREKIQPMPFPPLREKKQTAIAPVNWQRQEAVAARNGFGKRLAAEEGDKPKQEKKKDGRSLRRRAENKILTCHNISLETGQVLAAAAAKEFCSKAAIFRMAIDAHADKTPKITGKDMGERRITQFSCRISEKQRNIIYNAAEETGKSINIILSAMIREYAAEH